MTRGRVRGRDPWASGLPFSVEGWLTTNPLPPSGAAMFREVCAGAPMKPARSGPGSVAGHFASPKMHELVGFDSHTVELWACHLYDSLAEVLGYFAQPCSLRVRLPGRRKPDDHLVDFLVVEAGHAFLDGWKTEVELNSAGKGARNGWVLESGRWRWPAAEDAAAAFGMTYRLRSDAEFDGVFLGNLQFLAPYLDTTLYDIDPALRDRILQIVGGRPGVRVRDVVELLS